jgi:hypothetical protein
MMDCKYSYHLMTESLIHFFLTSKDEKAKAYVCNKLSSVYPRDEATYVDLGANLKSIGNMIQHKIAQTGIQTKGGQVLHINIGKANHSCVPNASFMSMEHDKHSATAKWAEDFDKQRCFVMRSLRAIKKGEEVFVNYTCGLFNCLEVRQKLIQDQMTFVCMCEFCELQKQGNGGDLKQGARVLTPYDMCKISIERGGFKVQRLPCAWCGGREKETAVPETTREMLEASRKAISKPIVVSCRSGSCTIYCSLACQKQDSVWHWC